MTSISFKDYIEELELPLELWKNKMDDLSSHSEEWCSLAERYIERVRKINKLKKERRV